MADVTTVQGIVIKSVTMPSSIKYLVLWCREFNHCYAYQSDIDEKQWPEALPTVWCKFMVENFKSEDGPEGISHRAGGIEVLDASDPISENPATTPDRHSMDIHRFNSLKVFSVDNGLLTFKTRCRLSPYTKEAHDAFGRNEYVYESYIGRVAIAPREYNEMRNWNIDQFECFIQLQLVAPPPNDGRSAWRVTHFVHEGKSYNFTGYMSIRGHYLRDREGNARTRDTISVIPDTLRPRGPSKPSKWSMYDNPSQMMLNQSQQQQYQAGINQGMLRFEDSRLASKCPSAIPYHDN